METFAKLSVSGSGVVSETFQGVGRLEKRLKEPAGRVFPALPPRFRGCRTRRGAIADSLTHVAVAEAERPHAAGFKPSA